MRKLAQTCLPLGVNLFAQVCAGLRRFAHVCAFILVLRMFAPRPSLRMFIVFAQFLTLSGAAGLARAGGPRN